MLSNKNGFKMGVISLAIITLSISITACSHTGSSSNSINNIVSNSVDHGMMNGTSNNMTTNSTASSPNSTSNTTSNASTKSISSSSKVESQTHREIASSDGTHVSSDTENDHDSTSDGSSSGSTYHPQAPVPKPQVNPVEKSVLNGGAYVRGANLSAPGSNMTLNSYEDYMEGVLNSRFGSKGYLTPHIIPYISNNGSVYYFLVAPEWNGSAEAGAVFYMNTSSFSAIDSLHQIFSSLGGAESSWNEIFNVLGVPY